MPSPTPENLNLSVLVWNLYLKIFTGDSVQQKLRAIASNSKILQFKTACLPFSLAVDALVPQSLLFPLPIPVLGVSQRALQTELGGF